MDVKQTDPTVVVDSVNDVVFLHIYIAHTNNEFCRHLSGYMF